MQAGSNSTRIVFLKLKYFVISVVLAAPWEQNTAAYICDTSDSLSQYASDEVSGMSYTPVSTIKE